MEKEEKKITINISENELNSFKSKSKKMGYKENLEEYSKKIFTSKHHIPAEIFNGKENFNHKFSFFITNDYYNILYKRALRLGFENKFQSFLRKIFFTKYFVANKTKLSDKDSWINVRVSNSEKKIFKDKAELLGMNLSDYSRQLLFKKDIVLVNPNHLIEELYDARGEVNKIGTNINQIANYANFLGNQKYVEKDVLDNFKKEAILMKTTLSDLKKVIDKTIKRI